MLLLSFASSLPFLLHGLSHGNDPALAKVTCYCHQRAATGTASPLPNDSCLLRRQSSACDSQNNELKLLSAC